jgi:hypothetical protein
VTAPESQQIIDLSMLKMPIMTGRQLNLLLTLWCLCRPSALFKGECIMSDNAELLARSNYFHVKDRQAFEAFCDRWDLELTESVENPGQVGFIDYTPDDHAGLVSECYYDENDELVIGTPLGDLASLLKDGEVAIIQLGGWIRREGILPDNSGLYAEGWAVAIHSDGRLLTIDINEIWAMADKEFNLEKNING